jgi:hypothetical protein
VAHVLPFVTTQAQLARFAVPDPQEVPRLLGQALRGEEALGLGKFCDLASGKLGNDGLSKSKAFGGALWLLWLRYEVRSYRNLMLRLQQLAQSPYYQAAGELQSIEGKAKGGKVYGLLTRILARSLPSAFRAMAKAQALESAVEVACAATRYRLDHGDYPPTAAVLVPDYLAAIPVDPFDGQALRYKKTGDGSVVIYAVGPDAVDHGGQVEGKSPADIGIILKLPCGR